MITFDDIRTVGTIYRERELTEERIVDKIKLRLMNSDEKRDYKYFKIFSFA